MGSFIFGNPLRKLELIAIALPELVKVNLPHTLKYPKNSGFLYLLLLQTTISKITEITEIN